MHRWAASQPDAVAAVGLGEDGSRSELTFAELSRDVTRLAELLVARGVGPGDRVAIFLPMSPEVAVASHAIAHIGAIQVPVFSGFAAPAVAQRLQASEAKVVITQRESPRRGRPQPMLEILEQALTESPSVEHVVLAPFELDSFPGELPAAQVDSETPYLLTYTSGTTGKPKGVVHVQGGFLVSIAREVCYQADVHAGDVVHFATDMGWIMGPWTVVGRRRARWHDRVRRRRARLADTGPALAHGRAGARDVARALADARAGAAAARRTHGRPVVAAHVRHDRRAVEPRAVPLALRERRRLARADHQLHRRHRGRRVLPLAHPDRADQASCSVGGPALGMAMDVVDDAGARSSAPARSASSSAAGRSPG